MINDNNIDRLDSLLAEDHAIDQLLLDIDPDTDLFWELTAQREAIQATMAILIAQRKAEPAYDVTLDPCSPDFDPRSWKKD